MLLRTARLVSLPSLIVGVALAATPQAAPGLALKKIGEHKLQTARTGAAAVAFGPHLYVIGGANEGGPLGDIERFDPATNKSERIFDALLPRYYHRALEHRGRFYLFGGIGQGSRTQPFEAAVEIYDPASNTVARGKDMPLPRAHMAAARLGDKFLLVGGAKLRDDGKITQTNESSIYDPATNTWAQGVPMPTPRESHAAVAGSMFIVAGGFAGQSARNEVEFFVPQENRWKTLPPLARTISAHALVLFDKHLLFFGDYGDLDLAFAYDLGTRQSAPAAAANFKGVRHSAAAVHGNRVYVIGGNAANDGFVSDLVQVFALEK